MNRKFELMDVIVAIGMIATVLGALAVFQASYGGVVAVTTSAKSVINPPMEAAVQAMLQPAMGQAIVDQAILEREFAADMIRGASKLASAAQGAEHHLTGGLDTIQERAAQFESDHKSRVQYVMGKIIVTLTGQGMRAGALTADTLSNPFNNRIISTAKAMGRNMEEAFAKNWQPRLGQWIVALAEREQAYAAHMQERIGQATVDLASLQHAYQTERTGLQSQVKALTAAAVRTEAAADRVAHVSMADINLQKALGFPNIYQLEVVGSRTYPEIPFVFLLVACAGLFMMFLVGLSLPRRGRTMKAVARPLEERNPGRYRKAG